MDSRLRGKDERQDHMDSRLRGKDERMKRACPESVLSCPDQVEAVFPYPGDEGAEEFMVVDFDFFAAEFLQVLVDFHEGGEPEAGLD